jgi:hypothetical protein
MVLEIESNTPTSSNSSPGPSSNTNPQNQKPSKATIQPAKRRSNPTPSQKLILWDTKVLESGIDPLGKGIALMMKKGALSVLFLSITLPPGSPVPHFSSSAAVLPKNKDKIWTGLRWDPTVVPEMWNYFIKSGNVELSPPGTQTVLSSSRNVIRAAFGLQADEWLLLVRAGPANACRGIVAFVSKSSLQTPLVEALPLLNALPPQTK